MSGTLWIEPCPYCRGTRRGRRRPCMEPCPESAVPGALYETCEGSHFACDGCWGGVQSTPDAEEAAEQLRDDEARAERRERKVEAQAAAKVAAAQAAEAREALQARYAALTVGSGLVCTDIHGMHMTDDVVLRGLLDGGSITLTRAESGALVQVRQHDACLRAWGTQAQVEAWALAYAHEVGITEARALAWRARYTGCAGQRMYDAILTEAGHDPLALDPAQLEQALAEEAAEEAAKEAALKEQRSARAAEREELRAADEEKARVRALALARARQINRLTPAQRRLHDELVARRSLIVAPRQRRTLAVLERHGLVRTTDGVSVAL